MKYLFILLISILLGFSCTRIIPSDLALDDLTDMKEYTGGMHVNCETYMGHQVTKILLNDSEIDNPSILN